jgi:two-component system, cell cycle sensor histidine kinase and response regulator CckA
MLEAVEQTFDGILIADSNRVVCYVNPAFEKMSGFMCDELVGKNAEKIWSDTMRNVFRITFGAVWNRANSWKGRMTNRRKDGSLYESETQISVVCDRQRKCQAFRDISTGT